MVNNVFIPNGKYSNNPAINCNTRATFSQKRIFYPFPLTFPNHKNAGERKTPASTVCRIS